MADGLRARLAHGDVAAGGALPSEAELGAQWSASRVTVRRALERLRDEGLVTSRRGSGWFAAHDPVRQPLGRITTVEAALEAAGAHPERRVLEFAFEPASPTVAAALELQASGDRDAVLQAIGSDGGATDRGERSERGGAPGARAQRAGVEVPLGARAQRAGVEVPLGARAQRAGVEVRAGVDTKCCAYCA